MLTFLLDNVTFVLLIGVLAIVYKKYYTINRNTISGEELLERFLEVESRKKRPFWK